MGFGTLEQLIAKGRPSPITSAISGFTGTAAAMQNLRKQQLANQIQQAQAGVAPQAVQAALLQAQAKPGLTQAETKMNLAKALQLQAASKAPFGGKFLPGAAGRAQGLQYIAQTYGTNSPMYKNTWRDYNADIEAKLGKAHYYEANLILKNVPDVNKMQIMENFQNEQNARVLKGYPAQTFKQWYSVPKNQVPSFGAPTPTAQGGQQAVSPGVTSTGTGQVPQVITPTGTTLPGQVTPQTPQPQATAQAGLSQEPFGQEARQTGVGITTKTEPTFVLQKLAFARNIQKTIARMPERAITAYSENPAKLANDYRKSLKGVITPDYAEYLKFITNAKFLSTQTRQFYGDTIQPSMTKRLDAMTNPISWRTSPKAALIAYHAMTGTLGKEIGTYVDESTEPKFLEDLRNEKLRESKVLKGQTVGGQPMPSKQQAVPKAKGADLTKLSVAELRKMYREAK